ncbi:16S rRNA processing protein RimM [Ruminiclostridium sufflavum DSM 19573]|uniref:Ribosome maturation factor RimM n=1 Tax=Ruminiclostridium sufflavum DSM 19573 TaxID=1121337 RepID=A0A318XMB8_9FIRM|nr:ribosome maturation factor RimM [Ruminiclostridium sufflavum]PYG87082.1 16S rRNA processing protein RimM [Ruminiclostridium sufflavum DSM 19573]
MLEYLIVGQLINTHGVKGELKAVSMTDDSHRFLDLKWVFIDKNGKLEKYNISGVKFFKQFVILKFEGVDSIDAAEKLKNLYMKVDRANAVRLPKGSFFIADIMGLQVYDENNSLLGQLKDVIHTGSNDVYVVKNEEGKELLIPALKSVVMEISPENGRISVILPKGLLD